MDSILDRCGDTLLLTDELIDDELNELDNDSSLTCPNYFSILELIIELVFVLFSYIV